MRRGTSTRYMTVMAVYLRPGSELTPTMAFRVDSWQTALQSGSTDIIEVRPPVEVVR